MSKTIIKCICGYVSVFVRRPQNAVCAKCGRLIHPST